MYIICLILSKILSEKILHRTLLLKRGVLRVEILGENDIKSMADMYQDAIQEFGC